LFETFRREVQKYEEAVHRLHPPASSASIDAAEFQLQVDFPQEYKAFLRIWNGGLLFAREFYDILIWSVADERVQSTKEYDCEVVQTNRALMERGHPPHLLGIAAYSDGNLVCLDLSRDGRAVLWLRDEGCIEQEWNTLTDWLTHEMEEGALLYDYHGNERE